MAVKVQREGLRPIYDLDLGLLARAAAFCDKLDLRVGGANQRWTDIFEEAQEILYREIDYRKEADNALRFAENFEGLDWVVTPKVYRELCTEKLLVMEFLPGLKISDVADGGGSGAADDARSLNDDDAAASAVAANNGKKEEKTTPQLGSSQQKYDREMLASNLARCYMYQFCKHGFFNTDPHPGNLAVDDKFPGGRLIFYDFGQACELTVDQREGILASVEAIIDLDAAACVRAFARLGVLKQGADLEQVEGVIRKNFESGRIRSKASSSSSPSSDVSTSTATSKEAEKASSAVLPEFTLPAQCAFVARALTQMDGVGKALDPNFEFIASAAPVIPEIKGGDVYAREWLQKKIGKVFS